MTKWIEDRSGTETQELAEWANQFVGRVHSIIKDVAPLRQATEEIRGKTEPLAGLAGNLDGMVSRFKI
ncbi:MAG TPA: hypothetical protein DGF30_04225 [Desulfomicrobium sp.]|nr:hypothetical protein [Desulfomicrobium sp.]